MRRFFLCFALLLPLFLGSCSSHENTDPLCGTFDRGGRLYRFQNGILTVEGYRMRYETDGNTLLLTRFDGEEDSPFRCSFDLDAGNGVLYLNGLPYYRAEGRS